MRRRITRAIVRPLVRALVGASALAFNPAAVFASTGAAGWIYDNSDQSTLYQDVSGTPVTALEQPVGMQLDKSRSMAIGSELVTNAADRTFSSDTGYWTKNAGVTIGSGSCAFSSVGGSQGILRSSFLASGNVYQITYTVLSVSAGGLRAYAGGIFAPTRTTPGTYVETILCGYGNSSAGVLTNGVSSGLFTNVSVKQIAGTHRNQTTGANRPVWSARYNGVIKTEYLDDAAWSKVGATAAVASVALPTGVSRACRITVTAGAGSHYEYQGGLDTYPAGSAVQQSFMVKKDTTQYGWIGDGGDAVWHIAVIDFDAGTITGQYNCTATAIALGNGWFLVTMKYTRTNAGVNRCGVAPYTSSTSTGVPSYTAAGTETMFATGADSRSQDLYVLLPSYQWVNTASDYDTSPLFPRGLRFNGSNQWMTNGSVDFSGTNKIAIFSGVRKFDTNTGIICEISANAAANPGSCYLGVNGSGTNDGALSRGSTTYQGANAAIGAAPYTKVMTMLGEISAPAVTFRANGVQVSQNTGAQGTGNYGAYPAYFGARAGTSLFFNGLEFSNIAIGTTLTSAQISVFEAWTNPRCRAYA